MWLWISIGLVGYLTLVGMILVVGAAARVGDRRERAIFATWLEERPRRVVRYPALRQRPRAA